MINNKLDLLALCETRVKEDAPATVKADLMPFDFRVLHVHRTERNADGCLTLFHREVTLNMIFLVVMKIRDVNSLKRSFVEQLCRT
jgi:hypothetical protein